MSRDDFFRMGYFHQLSGDLHSAAQCYLRSIENGPSAEAHTFLGWVLGLMGEVNAAIEECKRAIKLDPEFGNAWNDIGGYLMEQRKLDKAIPFLKRACGAKNYDSREYPHYNLGRIFIHKGMLLLAMQELRAAIEINPGFEPARRALESIEKQIH